MCLEDSFQKVSSSHYGYMNVFNKKNHVKYEYSNPSHNPNLPSRDEILSFLAPLIASGYFTGGAGAAQQEQQETKKVVEENKPKEPEKLVIIFKIEIKS